jgi:hypothetical protein
MPLHAITSVRGEVGLHERRLAEVAHCAAADRGCAEEALALASRVRARAAARAVRWPPPTGGRIFGGQ